MKKIYLLFLMALWLFGANAQVASYTFSQSTGTYTPITGGTLVANQTTATGTAAAALDDVNYTVALPFEFTYNGLSYASGTNINISSNGFIAFGAATTTNNYTPVSGSNNNTIVPFGVDCNGGWAVTGTTASGSPVITAISNTAGYVVGAIVAGTGVPTGATILSIVDNTSITISANCTSSGTGRPISCASGQIRAEQVGSTFVIQYRNFRPYNTSGKLINAQIVLHQTTNVIDVVYGTVVITGSAEALQVGLRGGAATDYNNRTGADWTASSAGGSNTATMALGITGGTTVPASGQTFTWTPPPPPATDISLLSIDNIPTGLCPDGSAAISVTLKNSGIDPLDFSATPATVSLNITGASTQTLTGSVSSGTLAAGATTAVALTPNANLSASGTHNFTAAVTLTGDGNAINNTSSASKVVALNTTSPMLQPFTTTATPTGWTTTGWSIGSTRGATGNPGNNIYFNLYSSATTAQFKTINIGPVGATDELTFDYKLSNYSSPYAPPAASWGNFVVQISTDCGTTFTDVATVNDPATAGWVNKIFSLSDYAGSTIAVRIVATWASGDFDIAFDNINVAPAPACPAPASLTIGSVGSATATATWVGTGTFVLEYGPTGFTPGTGETAGAGGTVINPATSAQLISGLTTSTAYQVYVRKNCSGSDNGFSTNLGPVSFTTTEVQLLSATSGNWDSPATWVGGVVPGCSDNVAIGSGHIVTVNSAANVSAKLSINAGGTLSVVSGDVVVGCTNQNSRLINNGTLDVSGGTLNVNGSVLISNASNFTQSGGNINVDGNAAGELANSVPVGTPIFAIGTATQNYATGTVGLTGGTLTIVDPHADEDVTFIYYGANVPSSNITTGAGHTLQLGDGVSTDPGGSDEVGFEFNQWEAYTGFKPNLLVNTGTGTNRMVNLTYTPSAFQNLTIESGEFFGTTRMHVEKNLTVNGTGILTTEGNVIMSTGTFNGTSLQITESASPNAQTISGTGTIRNFENDADANLETLTLNNSSASGVTLARPISVGTLVTMTLGNLNTSTTNLLTVGVDATVRGTITRTAGSIVGPVKKWFGTATGTTTLPVGTATKYKPVVINFTTAPTAGGTLTTNFSEVAPAFPNAAPLNEGALTVDYASTQGSWFVDAGDGLTGGNYTGRFTGTGATDVIDYTKTVLIKRPSAGGDWTLDGTHVNTTGSNTAPVLSRTGMSGFSEFAIGGQQLVALPIRLEYFRGTTQGSVNVLDWKVNSTDPSINISLERSADGRTFGSVYSLSATAARCLQPFDHTDADPLQVNYYRLKITDVSGKVSYSQIVVLLGKGRSFEISSLLPNPVLESAQLNVTSASSTRMEIRVTDIVGKTISNQTISVIAGSNKIPMNFSKLASGTYQITGKTSDGAIKTIRFVKQ